MKRDEFLAIKSDLNDFIRREILLSRKNILGEVVNCDFNVKFTAKEKDEIKRNYEDNIFVEKVEFSGTSITVAFTLKVSYADVANYLKNLPDFSETLFPSSYIFDENESVKWNREQVAEYNEGIKARKLLDISSRKILAETKKQATIYEVREFFGIHSVKYESIELLYNYLDGIYEGDGYKIAKQIYYLTETVLAFADSENLKIKRMPPFKTK